MNGPFSRSLTQPWMGHSVARRVNVGWLAVGPSHYTGPEICWSLCSCSPLVHVDVVWCLCLAFQWPRYSSTPGTCREYVIETYFVPSLYLYSLIVTCDAWSSTVIAAIGLNVFLHSVLWPGFKPIYCNETPIEGRLDTTVCSNMLHHGISMCCLLKSVSKPIFPWNVLTSSPVN